MASISLHFWITEAVYALLTPWPKSASELYRQSGRRRSVKLVPTFVDRGVSRVQRNGSPRPLISVFWTGAATFFIQVAPQLTSRGWVDPFPEPLLLRKSGSAGNRTRDLCICSQKLWPLDHRGGHMHFLLFILFCSRTIQYKCTKISYSWIAWTGTWNCEIWVSIFVSGIYLNYYIGANTL